MLSITLASDGDDVASMAWTLNVAYPVASRKAESRKTNVRVFTHQHSSHA